MRSLVALIALVLFAGEAHAGTQCRKSLEECESGLEECTTELERLSSCSAWCQLNGKEARFSGSNSDGFLFCSCGPVEEANP